MRFSSFTVPAGAEVTIDCFPEARHGADLYDLGCVNWVDPQGIIHNGLECALSAETAEHHFGELEPDVIKP